MMGHRSHTLSIALAALLLLGAGLIPGFGGRLTGIGGIARAQDVRVDLHTLNHVPPGSEICLSLEASDLTGLDVNAFQFEVRWDPLVLSLKDPAFRREGSLIDGPGWSATVHVPGPGKIRVAAWGTEPLAGSGSLGCIGFRASSQPGTWTEVDFESFVLNEGEPTAEVRNGAVFMLHPDDSDCVPVIIPVLNAYPESPICVPVGIGVATDGLEIYSFQGRIAWDPEMGQYDPAFPPDELVVLLPNGPADPQQWTIVTDTSVEGELSIAGYSLGPPMSGLGDLFCFRLRTGSPLGDWPVRFHLSFLLNEGAPCTLPFDGGIGVPVRETTWGRLKSCYR